MAEAIFKYLKGKKTVLVSLIVMGLSFIPGFWEYVRDAIETSGVPLEAALSGLFLVLRLVTSGKVNLTEWVPAASDAANEKLSKLPIAAFMAVSLAFGSMAMTSCSTTDVKDAWDKTRASATVEMGPTTEIPQEGYRVGVAVFGLELGIYGAYNSMLLLERTLLND